MTWVVTSKQRFYLHDSETLLDGLLRTGHNINYQCREGYCGSCRVQKIAHSEPIEYVTHPLAMVDEDEILPCCCRVQGVIHINEELIID
ncbi:MULTISPECIES: class I ribonucleotide reductase maintenance protein YfaE [unclassified Psychrobacter]|uniref:class I ribonucleotide reductase maintenance protein YfaE n=1 Tax=unclassified Psychrobacter TaxID=196806 RepID=UPI0018F66BDD|nr:MULTISPECIES: class I ribonucleotide reductase maintenance protein YfaE [unclassified Psychrobacter]